MENERADDNLTPGLEYTRLLFKNILDWYKNADTKAQIILSLDGVFLTVVVNSLFKETASISRLSWYSLALLGLMCIALTFSLYHAISCLWSRIYRQSVLDAYLRRAGVDKSDYNTYAPSVCFFFECISALDKAEFERRMRTVTPAFEVDALASQIYLLSANVSKKHRHVNYGFAFAVVTLLLFLMSGVSAVFSG
jgi:hypothetical protein